MKEPELEEEALTATAEGSVMTITRRTLGTGARDVVVTAPGRHRDRAADARGRARAATKRSTTRPRWGSTGSAKARSRR